MRVEICQENVIHETYEQEVVKVKVESASEPGKFYHVSLTASCQCPAWVYRNRCRHIKEVLASLGK